MSDDLEELRQKRLMELQQQMASQQEQAARQQEVETQVQLLLKQVLTPEAKARLANVRLADAQKYATVVSALVQLYKAGQLREKVTDEQLKGLLVKLAAPKREINITKRSKVDV